MKARTGNRQHRRRRRISSGGKPGRDDFVSARDVLPGIVCQYGVVVQCTLIPGMELIEFEFLPDAA